jgi:RimJ/RimL family protein N-acetyltransferase
MLEAKTIDMRLAREGDAAFILRLRTDPALNQHLSPTSADEAAQRAWLRAYQEREAAGQEYYFIIQDKVGAPVGTVRLYDFRSGRESFCWGSWILLPTAPRKAAIESAVQVYEYAFGTLGFAGSHFDVRRDNAHVLAFHDRFGATRVGQDADNVYFTLSAQDYARLRPGYAPFRKVQNNV